MFLVADTGLMAILQRTGRLPGNWERWEGVLPPGPFAPGTVRFLIDGIVVVVQGKGLGDGSGNTTHFGRIIPPEVVGEMAVNDATFADAGRDAGVNLFDVPRGAGLHPAGTRED